MMLMDGHVNENTKQSLAHFFGVFDGHGGSQVYLKILPINYSLRSFLTIAFAENSCLLVVFKV
jgi:hypothetical protein